jgi:ketosteroid isomerase-like protein
MMLLLFIAALLAPSPAPNSWREEDRAELTAFADAFDRAQIAKDRRKLEEMVSDDLVFIDGTGARRGKKDFIAGWTAPEDSYAPIKLIDRTVTMLGPDAGIVQAEVTVRGESSGVPFSSRIRFSDAFKRVRDRWLAVHIQVTRVAAAERAQDR